MGILSSPPEGAEVEDVSDDTAAEPEAQVTTEPEVPAEKSVPLPEKPLGRREQAKRAAEEQAKELNALKSSVTQMQEENRRALAEQRAEYNRMVQENFQRQQMAQQQATQPKPADHMQLYREAKAHLDRGEFDQYQEKQAKATIAQWRAENPERPQQQQPQGMDPRLQAVIMTTPSAGKVMTHERGIQMAQVKDNELDVMGIPPGPERWRKAFELAEQALFGGQAKGGFPASGRSALAGVPTTRSNGAPKDAGPQVKPPSGWEKWASRAGMSKDEYLRIHADAHPESITDK